MADDRDDSPDPDGPDDAGDDRRATSPAAFLPPELEELVLDVVTYHGTASFRPHLKPPIIGKKYEALRRLGEGGYGAVFLARDPELDRLVALKVCPGMRADAAEVFRREAQLIAKLTHPNIVTAHELGYHEIGERRFVFYAMEYVEGADAAQHEWSSEDEVLDHYEAAAAGLAAAHERGIVHGDFKPANLLIGADGRARVADFGLAQLIEVDDNGDPADVASHRMGTVPYMAPEVLRGDAPSKLSDQWAFFVALWETLDRGRFPFVGKSVEELLAKIDSGEHGGPVPNVPAGIDVVLRRGLSLDPADRYADMGEVLAALRGVRAPPPPGSPPQTPEGAKRGVFVLALVLVVGSVLATLAVQHASGVRRPETTVANVDLTRHTQPCVIPLHLSDIELDSAAVQTCGLIQNHMYSEALTLWELAGDKKGPDLQFAAENAVIAQTWIQHAEMFDVFWVPQTSLSVKTAASAKYHAEMALRLLDAAKPDASDRERVAAAALDAIERAAQYEITE